jgi:hypothetical protein
MATNFFSIMDSVEEYARRWTKSEGEELDTLSELIKSIRKLLKYLSGKMRTTYPSVFKKTEMVNIPRYEFAFKINTIPNWHYKGINKFRIF